MHTQLNRLTARDGERRRVLSLLVESGRLFDDNSACLLYLVTEAADDPNVIWVFDLWTSREEHEQALAQPELKPYIAEALPLLVGRPEQLELRVAGGKGPGLEG